MNAASNIGIIPAVATDRTPRSGSVSNTHQKSSGVVSFADTLKSAHSSAAPKAPAEKTGVHTASKSSMPVKSDESTDASSTATTSSTDQAEASVDPTSDLNAANAPSAQTVDPSRQVNTDAAVQQAAVKAQLQNQLQDKNVVGDADSQDGKTVDASKTVVSGTHSADIKPVKKHASLGAAITADKDAAQQIASQPVAAQTVPVVVATPATTTNDNANQPKANVASVGGGAKGSKVGAAAATAPQVSTPIAGANAVPANVNVSPDAAEDTDISATASSFADKIIAAAGPQHAANLSGSADSFQQGATFSYSLHNASNLHTQTSESAKATVDTKSAAATEDVNPSSSFTPIVRKLEVAVNDPVLGNVDVRAEMRGGVLHASISGTQANVSAAAELHQFLQQNQVAVHTVSFHNTADAIRPTQQGAASSFSNTDSGSRENAQYSGSNAQQQNRESSERNSFVSSYRNDSVYGSTFNLPASSQIPAAMLNPQTSGGNLSIHI